VTVRSRAAAGALLTAACLAGCGTTGSAGPKNEAPAATVPGVVGQSIGQADAALSRAGFSVQAAIVRGRRPRNAVVSQDPRAGTRSHRGDTVRVSVSDGVAG
jgi:beta-lactam-binding protein with PASTA domain